MDDDDPRIRPLGAVRLALVIFGGPLALLAAFAVAAAETVRALGAGQRPRPRSLGALGAGAAYAAALPTIRGWGSTGAERRASLAGDELVPRPSVQHTRAVTIDAPPEQVWPWLAQIGQDRGGFYSYTWLENLGGCRMTNADRVHPEWPAPQLGERVWLHPRIALRVLGLDSGHALTLSSGWCFVLEDGGGERSRLIARWRSPAGVGNLAFALLFDLPHFVMERRMLLGIKRRAERPRRRRARAEPAGHSPRRHSRSPRARARARARARRARARTRTRARAKCASTCAQSRTPA
ncbi:MAG TPA: hypothetical protein VGO80_04165 [Solirubrobacteraceae bacterium]|jgi:hypothetical protein|nr:hypothetical protein [Solirubrobacteraceae bacterium]